MKPITDPSQIAHYGLLLRQMMLTAMGQECEFNPNWTRSRGWKVVPSESMARIPTPDIPRIAMKLRDAGHRECVAVYNEPGYIQNLPAIVATNPPSDMSTCYLLSIDEADFREFNHELGSFRSVLMPEDQSWAISCNEWYNLFGAKPDLVKALLGKSIEQAREEFLAFALSLAHGKTDDLLLKVSKHYSAI